MGVSSSEVAEKTCLCSTGVDIFTRWGGLENGESNVDFGATTVATLVFSDGSCYFGDVATATNLPHGKGSCKFVDGNEYEGYWINGKISGKGIMQFQNGKVYEGDWKHNKFNGSGTLIDHGGQYEGDFLNGQKHGQGKYTWTSGPNKGDVYVGEYVQNRRHGMGTITHKETLVYQGEFHRNERHGFGSYLNEQGQNMEGTFKHDKIVPTSSESRKSTRTLTLA